MFCPYCNIYFLICKIRHFSVGVQGAKLFNTLFQMRKKSAHFNMAFNLRLYIFCYFLKLVFLHVLSICYKIFIIIVTQAISALCLLLFWNLVLCGVHLHVSSVLAVDLPCASRIFPLVNLLISKRLITSFSKGFNSKIVGGSCFTEDRILRCSPDSFWLLKRNELSILRVSLYVVLRYITYISVYDYYTYLYATNLHWRSDSPTRDIVLL